MKGIGIGLFVAVIIIPAIVVFITLLSFGFISAEAFGLGCEQDVIAQISNWVQKMKVPAAQEFDDKFRARDCIEHITKEGIKFKKQDIRKFYLDYVEGKQENPVFFEFDGFSVEDGKVRLQERTYDVTVDPDSKTITIHNR